MQNTIDKFKAEVRKELGVQSNADRIRSFSDEELAEWFSTVTDDALHGSIWSKDGWMKYLQSEVEE